ncbi:hypothetical protein BDV96DRAFT_26117 [Lophiotrema nucula]|uniref:Short-chain dehydrogenase n=1 Tax=Lophiotrema nucula TaxID=690887 RepID=A0A6A5ZG98_9PLEO|nr:hypothetical protein BDV96DRAFT_26117 [Lophiotrema nucula]
MGNLFSQYFPPKPIFTDKECPDLTGKVYIATGSNTGVGKELAQILYAKNAKVYIAARSQYKAEAAIESIIAAHPKSTGTLAFLHLDLSDLSTIKASAQEFLSQETKLHVLFNNAAVMCPPVGTKTLQGLEMAMGVNCVGPQLFTSLLTPILIETAKVEPPNTVRVVWVASMGAEVGSYTPGGVDLNNLNLLDNKIADGMHRYARTKAGNYLQGAEYAKRMREHGIMSVPLNPGHLKSDLYRAHGSLFKAVLSALLLYPPVYGAYTELFAGLSPDVTLEATGEWVVCWGRFAPIRKDLIEASKSEKEGGSGVARKFWEWNEEQIKAFL